MQINLQHEEQAFKPVVLKMIIESEDELNFWLSLCAMPVNEILNIKVSEELGVDPEISRDCIEPLRETFIANDLIKAEIVQNRFIPDGGTSDDLKQLSKIWPRSIPPCTCGKGTSLPHLHNPACSRYLKLIREDEARVKAPTPYLCICRADQSANSIPHTAECHYANQRRERGDDHAHSA